MRSKLFWYCILAVPFWLALGCSHNRFSPDRRLEGYLDIGTIDTGGRYDKAICDPKSGVVFALSKASQEVHIFRGGNRINSIGGVGFERTNFQRLSDIGLDNDGGLLALDSSLKVLRKFTELGGLVAELQLPDLQQPELFCVGPDGTLYIYDGASAELISFSRFDATELYRFGRFVLELPQTIACNNDYLYAYSLVNNSTYVFYLLGQYKETLPAEVIFDPYNNPIQRFQMIPVQSSVLPYRMSITNTTVCLLYDKLIRVAQLRYSRGNDAQE